MLQVIKERVSKVQEKRAKRKEFNQVHTRTVSYATQRSAIQTHLQQYIL